MTEAGASTGEIASDAASVAPDSAAASDSTGAPDGAAASSPRILAGRYRIGALLGKGGMAEVYAATDVRLGRQVAVKLLRPALANDPRFRTRFRQEAQAAAKMTHPTIVRVFDAGEENVLDADGVEQQLPFIVMERVEGELLSNMLRRGPVEPTEAARIIEGVLTALEYSHRAGVVHRDVKPGNIMVAANGQVKVMDFGIARAISESNSTIARTSAILGTARYFSPEQARGEAVDARTDLYSTGIVLYELLTGEPPFRNDSPVGVAYQHVSETPVPPARVNPEVSPALSAVVMRSLAKDRFDRYQSAAEFRQDLAIAASGKVPAQPAGGDDGLIQTLYGVNPASITGGDATLRRLASGDDRAPKSVQSRPPVAWIWGGIAVMVLIVVAVMVWVFSLQPGTGFSASVTVPKLTGLSYQAAEAKLKDLGLTSTQLQRSSLTVPVGQIISSNPGAGQHVANGQEVTLTVSTGPAQVTIPTTLQGMTEADAVNALKAAGLVLGDTSTANSATIAQGSVVATEPTLGSTLNEGSKVNLVLSTGLVTVPSVVGQSITSAQAALQDPSVGAQVATVPNYGCAGKKVVSQSVTGDQPQGVKVTLHYCAYTAPVATGVPVAPAQ